MNAPKQDDRRAPAGARAWVVAVITATLLAACTTEGPTATPTSPAKRADIHADLAWGYMKRGQDDIAGQELEHALAVAPNHPRSNYYMAILKSRRQEFDAAEKYYVAAIDADPKYTEAVHNYAALLCARGKRDKSIRYFDRALADASYPARPLAFQHLGECLYNTKPRDAVGAERALRQALELDPNLAASLRLMAQISYDTGRYLSARAFIERYFAGRQESAPALLLAVKIEQAMKNRAAADRYAERLVRQYPKSPEAQSLVAPSPRK